MAKARLFVLVHDLVGQPVKSTVEYLTGKKRKFLQLDYDHGLQRYVGHLEPGPCKLRIQGPRGTSEEQRDLDLVEGHNHVYVMVAEPGLPALRTPEGNWYFKTRVNERLLHVRGQGARQRTSEILKKNELSFERLASRAEIRDDDVLFRVSVGSPEGEEIERLERITSETLPELGLTGRVVVPGYVGDDVAFGLTDEIIIRFQSYATVAQVARLARRHSLQQLRQISWIGNAFLFRYPKGASIDLLDLIDDLNRDPLVVFAELNVATRLQNFAYTPTDYLYPETPHLPLINADDAWDTIQTSTNVNRGGSPDVVIAILDLDGVDPTHPDLTGPLSDGTDKQIANFDFVNMMNQTLANCPGDHGTQCAGSATARFDNSVGASGVAPNCKFIGGRFSGFSTDLEIADIWVWMAGFPIASAGFPTQLAQGAHIISNSWGPSYKPPTQTLRDAFNFLATYPRAGRGVIMVFAIGNYGYSLVDALNPFAADQKTLGIGASINTNPTNPVNSLQADHQGNANNLPAVADTRSYISPYGLTVDLVSPSHTCYGPGLPGAGIVDPIMAPVRTGCGNWPANAVSMTTLTQSVSPAPFTALTAKTLQGDTTLNVDNNNGFEVNQWILVGKHDKFEFVQITAIPAGNTQLTVTALQEPNEYSYLYGNHNYLPGGMVIGITAINVDNNVGFVANQWLVLDQPGQASVETAVIQDVPVGTNQILIAGPLNIHAVGTSVATGPNNYAMNSSVGFGGTSHSCPTVAGAVALLLSVKPDLNWIEVRQILQTTAEQIDAGQADATGQWVDLDGDGVNEFSQWYGYGRLDVNAAVSAAISLTVRSDVVVRDNLGDTGTVPSAGWHATSPDIWVRKTSDPIPALAYGDAPPHENPHFGQDNYVFLRVRNNGTGVAPVIYLRALITHFPGIEFQYPDDWQPTPRFGVTPVLPLQLGTYLIGESVVNNLAAGASTIVKMTWDKSLVPPQTVTEGGSTVTWHPCLLAEASPHDGPAIVMGLAYPVKGDNNIAHRNIAIDYTEGNLGLMNAVVAGTRDASGIDSLVIDRTALPADISVVLRTPNVSVMKNWIELVRSGRGILKAEPLGATRPKPTPIPEILSAKFRDRECCDITLLTDACLAVQCCDDDLLLIDAPRGTSFRHLCTGEGNDRLRDCVQVDYWKGQHVIRINHGAGAIALPLRMAANMWTPVFVGTDVPNGTGRLRGRILVSQVRADGEVSPGYEIEV